MLCRKNFHPGNSFFAGNAPPVRQQRDSNWIAAAAKTFNRNGWLTPREFQVALSCEHVNAVTSRVVDPQQIVVAQFYVEVWAGHDESRDVPLLALVADSPQDFAGAII